jgi:hypothetical protein
MADQVCYSPPEVKVIVADDEHVTADTVAVILTKAGFEVRAVYSRICR